MKKFSIIVAVDEKMGIGKCNALPWRLSGDMQHFKDVTLPCACGQRNAVIMGRKTWESLPERYRPLPGRLNVVLSVTSTSLWLPGVVGASSLEQALELLSGMNDVADIFVIGGGRVFAQAIQHRDCNRIYLTRIKGDFSCDVFFPSLTPNFRLTRSSEEFEEGAVRFVFYDFEKS